MAIATIQLDDGRTVKVEVPDGATEQEINDFVSANLGSFGQSQAKAPGQSTRGNIGQQFLQGASFNFGDEAMGGIANTFANIYSKLANTDIGNAMGLTGDSQITGDAINKDINITTATESVRDDLEAFEERNPGTALAAQVAGGMFTGGPLGARMIGANPTLGRIAATAAVEGGLFGLGSGEGTGNRLEEMVKQGGGAAILGPLAKIGADKIAGKFMRPEATRLREALTPTKNLDTLKDEAQAFYKTADDSGFKVTSDSYKGLKNNLEALFKKRGIDGKRYPKLSKAITRIRSLKEPNYQDLESIKDMLHGAQLDIHDKASKTYANQMTKAIDDFVGELSPGDVSAGNLTNVKDHLIKARDLWSRKSQGEVLEDMKYRARLSEAELDTDNLDKAMRQQIRPTLVSEKKRIGLDDEVITGLEDIVSGTNSATKRQARSSAHLSPGASTARGGTSALITGGTGVAFTGSGAGALLALIPGMGGAMARKLANRITKEEFDRLQDAVVNRGQLEVDEVLKEIMKDTSMARGGGATAAGATASTQLSDVVNGR